MSFIKPEAADRIVIEGAREHNLKNISVEIPRGKFVVITGVSGSGKSTLAFDLIFSEGQRRFLDSMNTYARQFVEQMARPEVDRISGIPPTVSIEQRNSRGGGKSTVATVTEIYHFMRLLYARVGVQFCPDCLIPVTPQTRDALFAQATGELKSRGPLRILAPVIRNRKGFHTEVAEEAARNGIEEIRADGKFYSTSAPFRLARFQEHDIELVIGEVKTTRQLGDLLDRGLSFGAGTLHLLDAKGGVTVHSTSRACPKCARSFEELDPKMFSYNSARGWCPKCRGFGETFYLPDIDRGESADRIEESWFNWQEGEREICPECRGHRLNASAAAVRLDLGALASGPLKSTAPRYPGFVTLPELNSGSVAGMDQVFRKLSWSGRDGEVARDILPEIRERLRFLEEVGLGYLQLGRSVTTLSSGEAQRIRLAAQLGSNLSGVLYVLDEPTIGLHARDNEQLLHALALLRSKGNSLIVVEHDEETMRRADHIIDLGPGAGIEGGTIVAQGTLSELMSHEDSLTARYLRTSHLYPTRGERRNVSPSHPMLTIQDVSRHNLKDVTVSFPLERLIMVTGVSGSGKSTLVRDCLVPSIQARLQKKKATWKLEGGKFLKALHEVDQSPIGRTPRSTPATYVGFFDEIRSLFAQVPEARLRGYTGSRFSFNSKEGRCEHCEGAGELKLEMNFLPPAYVRCEACSGTRYKPETLDILYRGKNISQVLDLSVAEARLFFDPITKIRAPLQALLDTGLGYLKLGQTSPTLSGGEAQRMKLVTYLLTGLKKGQSPDLSQFIPQDERSLFVLEEPSIGLHMADVQKLVAVLQRLVDRGHTVIVIEHNFDLIAEADWVIDLGPEGGGGGGSIVCEGTPEQVCQEKRSHTGQHLKKFLKQAKNRRVAGD